MDKRRQDNLDKTTDKTREGKRRHDTTHDTTQHNTMRHDKTFSMLEHASLVVLTNDSISGVITNDSIKYAGGNNGLLDNTRTLSVADFSAALKTDMICFSFYTRKRERERAPGLNDILSSQITLTLALALTLTLILTPSLTLRF
jgi:hypothetical protein